MDSVNSQTTQVPDQISEQPQKPLSKFIFIIIGLILAIGIGFGGYYLGQQKEFTPTPTPIQTLATPIPTINPTANWKTYKYDSFSFSFKYPSEWELITNTPKSNFSQMNLVDLKSPNVKMDHGLLDGANLIITATKPNSDTLEKLIQENTKFLKKFNKKSHTISGINGFLISSDEDQQSGRTWPRSEIYFEYQNYYFIISYQINGNNLLELSNTIDQILSTFKFTEQSTNSPTIIQASANGVTLENIKYKLPEGWNAQISNESLFLSPSKNGGFLAIKVYDYPNNIGRREYYCQITKYCIEGTTTYKEMKIGNISGYKASGIDNSGGGSDYFGAKDSKFYIIGTFSTPFPNEFDKYFQEVLDSLVF